MGYVLLGEMMGIMLGSILEGAVYPRGGYSGVIAMMLAFTTLDLVWRPALVEQKRAVKWTDLNGSTSLHSDPSLGDLRRKEERVIINRANISAIGNECPINSPNGGPRPLSNSNTGVSNFAGRLPSAFFLINSPRVLTDVCGGFVCYVLL